MIGADDPLATLLRPERLIEVVDVGASPYDGGDPPYKSLLNKGLCGVTGFEPDAGALAILNEKKGPNETYLPYAVGDGQEATLHICRAATMASLLEPDPETLAMFAEFSEFGRIVGRKTVSTARLDDVKEISGSVDFLKIDAQGSELAVFRNGRTKLAAAVAVHTEVSFIPFYKNQPVFGVIDIELRSLGLVPHTFIGIQKRLVAPLRSANPRDHINQMMEADAVYVRDFRDMSALTADQLKNMALICHHAYGSFDIAARCVFELQTRNIVASNAMKQYASIIGPQKR
jgi:FkbM family methyltransferase